MKYPFGIVSDDPIRNALSELPSLGGVESGYVRKAAEHIEALPFATEEVEAWILDHDGYPDDRRHARNQLGSGVSTRRAPKTGRSWLIPVDALNVS